MQRGFQSWILSFGGVLISILLCGCCGLPKVGEHARSTSLKSDEHTALAAAVQPLVAAHPGQSGLHPLAKGRDAFDARLALADAAQCSLDLQYYIWHSDQTGRLLVERLIRAADRGVRVRVLLDDFGASPSDRGLLALDSHPNIEVRLFNPVTTRSARLLGTLFAIGRMNRRMHNKAFIADQQAAIVGGRNIGDEYFAAHAEVNFADLDVVAIGPVVDEVADSFDLYWNSSSSIPMPFLSGRHAAPHEVAADRAALTAHDLAMEESSYMKELREGAFARNLLSGSLPWDWGNAWTVYDHPDKVTTSTSDTGTHLTPRLRGVTGNTKEELLIVSPYFVPGKEGVALLTSLRQRGVRVVVVTNSRSSTDVGAVHAGYQRYRKPLLRAGVELYEVKSTAGTERVRSLGGLRGSSRASLHAKTFTFDRRLVLVGSMNLDPRSQLLNTEIGVLFDCPELAARLPGTFDLDLDHNAYRLELTRNRLSWVTRENEKEVRFDSEPEIGLWCRFTTCLLGWLPIESQL